MYYILLCIYSVPILYIHTQIISVLKFRKIMELIVNTTSYNL